MEDWVAVLGEGQFCSAGSVSPWRVLSKEDPHFSCSPDNCPQWYIFKVFAIENKPGGDSEGRGRDGGRGRGGKGECLQSSTFVNILATSFAKSDPETKAQQCPGCEPLSAASFFGRCYLAGDLSHRPRNYFCLILIPDIPNPRRREILVFMGIQMAHLSGPRCCRRLTTRARLRCKARN